MNQETVSTGSWRTHLLLTGSVLFTVLLALLLAQLDSLQQQILPSPVAFALTNLNATATNTPLPAIPLASRTPTVPGSDTVSEQTAETVDIVATSNPIADCGPPFNWVRYTVRRGETMLSLALRSGTTISAILNANCLTSNTLRAGQIIFLPPTINVPPTATVVIFTATPTPSATATSTVTGTPTATVTGTAPPPPTVSITPTLTVTGTVTATPSVTVTSSQTPTSTVTASATATLPVSMTPTGTAVTPSVTPTPSATSSVTPTLSPTPSVTPINSATPSDTPIPTATPTPVDTATVVAAPTTTPSPVPTP